jgi:VCBS repeat-containing protein
VSGTFVPVLSGSAFDVVFATFVTVTPPHAHNDSYSIRQDHTLRVHRPGVLKNDSDLDKDKLSAKLARAPRHGTLTLNANGSFTYKPRAGFSGSDSFRYRASDGTATSKAALVRLTVTATPARGRGCDGGDVNQDATQSSPAGSQSTQRQGIAC